MRSQYADKFNHDEDAPGYDRDVANTADPIRSGYAELLDWVASKADVDPSDSVLELGSGTGNLSSLLLPCRRLVCVDISRQMTALAREKLAKIAGPLGNKPNPVEFVESDLLSFFDRPRYESERFDRVVSTYTIHHLTESEKRHLFRKVASLLEPSGAAVFGDLMFENEEARGQLIGRWRRERKTDLVETVEDEMFWDLASAEDELRALGFEIERKRFSDLSWGLFCVGRSAGKS